MRKGKVAFAFVLLMAASLVLSACGGSGPSAGGSSSGGTNAITITAKESGCPSGETYCWDPPAFTVTSGQPVKVTVVNPSTNANAHSFEVQNITGAQSGDVAPGSQKDVTFTAPAAGSYPFICAVPGHADLGMKGTLSVK